MGSEEGDNAVDRLLLSLFESLAPLAALICWVSEGTSIDRRMFFHLVKALAV